MSAMPTSTDTGSGARCGKPAPNDVLYLIATDRLVENGGGAGEHAPRLRADNAGDDHGRVSQQFIHLENAQDRADVIAYLKERAK